MNTLMKFEQFVNEINKENSRLYKQSVLKKYSEDKDIKKYLQLVFDPFKVYGLSARKINKSVTIDTGCFSTVYDLFDYLEYYNTGRDRDIAISQASITHITANKPELAELLKSVICKDLSIGIDAKIINSIIPGLIPTFNVMLANKYFDKPEVIKGKEFAITTKIDGGRIIALKENGQISFYTRAGQKYEGLVDLENEMLSLMPDNCCLDGEITLLDRGSLSSKEAYKQTMKIVRKTTDFEKHGVKMLVFDGMPASDFRQQKCNFPYYQRRAELDKLFSSTNFKYFNLLPVLYVGTDTKQISTILEKEISKGEEGIMVNDYNALYEFKRTNALLKCKKFDSLYLEIIDFEEGTGKLSGTLGAFICKYKNGEVKVGSGLTEEQRKLVWLNKDKYINTIIQINFFEETTDSTGKPSLRFPTFSDFRPDKLEPNY